MVALSGPNSMTCAPVGAMKRPSDVPPDVDSSVSYAAELLSYILSVILTL